MAAFLDGWVWLRNRVERKSSYFFEPLQLQTANKDPHDSSNSMHVIQIDADAAETTIWLQVSGDSCAANIVPRVITEGLQVVRAKLLTLVSRELAFCGFLAEILSTPRQQAVLGGRVQGSSPRKAKDVALPSFDWCDESKKYIMVAGSCEGSTGVLHSLIQTVCTSLSGRNEAVQVRPVHSGFDCQPDPRSKLSEPPSHSHRKTSTLHLPGFERLGSGCVASRELVSFVKNHPFNSTPPRVRNWWHNKASPASEKPWHDRSTNLSWHGPDPRPEVC